MPVGVPSGSQSIGVKPVIGNCFITDVRPLMTLPREPDAKRWGWAENCGGGDFLVWKDTHGSYQPIKANRRIIRLK